MLQELAQGLERRRAEHLYRERRVVHGRSGTELSIGGHRFLNFCSNDYLGLAGDPRIAEVMAKASREHGAGSGAAHLVTGHSKAHHALEEELAEFTGRDSALLFSTGYMANLGVIASLTGRGDSVFEDRLNHASLLDGGLISHARMQRYPHADTASLERQLAAAQTGRKLVVSDGVFSMDGDVAPVVELAKSCADHNAWLMLDDAHGLGVVGPKGAGSLAAAGLGQAEVPVLMGTLGKAFGTFGAFVAGPEVLIETLIQQARPYIYTTAPPPAVAEASRAALRLAQKDEWRRERLAELIIRFRRGVAGMGLELMASDTPIQPILAGSPERAMAWSRQLEARGILVTAIRPPTVPDGTARLRITFSATHTDAQLDRLLDGLQALDKDE